MMRKSDRRATSKSRLIGLAVAFALAFGLSSTAHAATLVVGPGGLLTGATGISLGGNLYDVDFLDGTCAGVFGSCDAATTFTFNTSMGAATASNALLAQVFAAGDIFDTDPDMTRGVSSTARGSFAGLGDLLTPYSYFTSPFSAASISAISAENYGGTRTDLATSRALFPAINTAPSGPGAYDPDVWVVWTLTGPSGSIIGGGSGGGGPAPVVSAVPLPAALPLFLSGLAGLGLVGRRRRKRG